MLKDRIVDAAIKTNSQAIHPGYGFLSENSSFAQYCHHNNLIFIGPPPNAIECMGIKRYHLYLFRLIYFRINIIDFFLSNYASKSKEIMSEAGVPVIIGYHGIEQNPDFLQQQANEIGYPVMIKAIKGGGGKVRSIFYVYYIFVWHKTYSVFSLLI